MIFEGGECVYASVTDNWPATRSFEQSQGKFNETGSNSPSVLSDAQQAELVGLGVASTKALGFRLGVFCLNCKYTSRGARLIEINRCAPRRPPRRPPCCAAQAVRSYTTVAPHRSGFSAKCRAPLGHGHDGRLLAGKGRWSPICQTAAHRRTY